MKKGLKQKAHTTKANVSWASYIRFDSFGEISLHSLVMIAFELDMTEEFKAPFISKTYQSIDDIIKG